MIDASLPRSIEAVIKNQGHDATDVRDIGLGSAPDHEIATYVEVQRLALITRDFDFADIRHYPPEKYAGIVVVDLPSHATVPTITKLIASFLQQQDVLDLLPGRLAILEPGHIRLRPKP